MPTEETMWVTKKGFKFPRKEDAIRSEQSEDLRMALRVVTELDTALRGSERLFAETAKYLKESSAARDILNALLREANS